MERRKSLTAPMRGAEPPARLGRLPQQSALPPISLLLMCSERGPSSGLAAALPTSVNAACLHSRDCLREAEGEKGTGWLAIGWARNATLDG